ncbi:hypothetical protein ACFYR1_08895 [Streptomyces canus]|uniref:hypothetical protein n=1 Tax=Streptomyces canus TaxID=58343 RepID=UPI003683D243
MIERRRGKTVVGSGSFLVAGAALGTAYGFAFASLGGLVVDAVPAEQTGAATGVNTILRTIGGAAGAQLATAIVTGSAGGGSTVHGSCVRHSRTHPGSDDKYRVRPSSGGRKRRLGETG